MSLPSFHSNEKINVLGPSDDSFDDEFRLLESTLTDFKEDQSNAEGRPTKSEKRLIDSGIFSLGLAEVAPADCSKDLNNHVNVRPLKQEGTLLSQEIVVNINSPIGTSLISSNSFKCTLSKNFESVGLSDTDFTGPLPTNQHFKPLTKSSLVSSSESIDFKCVSLNSVSNCDILRSIMESSSKPLCSVEENVGNEQVNSTVVNVAPCDSSLVKGQEGIKVSSDGPVQSRSNTEVELAISKNVLPEKLDNTDLISCKELEKYKSNEADNFRPTHSDPDCQIVGFKTASDLQIQNKSMEQNQIFNTSQFGGTSISGDVMSENNIATDLKQNDKVMQSTGSEDAVALCPTAQNCSAETTDSNLELKVSSGVLTPDTKLEDNLISSSKTNECLSDNEQIKDETPASSDKNEKSNFFCSTPIVNNLLKDNILEDSSELMSPLNTNYLKRKINTKRANLCLERIEEADEGTDSCSDKRVKLDNSTDCFENKISLKRNDISVSSSMSCFEAPAKSILKKWHPSGLSRDSFLVLDECGESDSEETVKPSQESVDHTSVTLDDFEVACRSLAEELLMSSSNHETLEKYHSQVQLDSQMDDKMFDEALQELTSNYEIDEKSFFSKMKAIDENKFVKRENVTNFSNMTMEESLNNTENKENPLALVKEGASSDNKTVLAEVKWPSSVSGIDNSLSIKQEDNPEPSSSNQNTKLNCENESIVSIKGVDEKLPVKDEEDKLLDDDVNVEQKQFVYFEYVSLDPKENEDNYNPEWQKLGKLTSDEERYKAVRDRWRSLVPPDPNRDLTCRQWRKRNNKPPLNIPSINKNQRMFQFDCNEKSQLCTAVFERKIANLLQGLQMKRIEITKERKMRFEELAVVQDEQQRRVLLRGTDAYEMSMLQKHHIQECVMLKNKFDMQLDQITKTTENSVMALKSACDEVMSFQKFYKGVGATDREVCIYMTDIQVEELMETEEMLEQYSKYYK